MDQWQHSLNEETSLCNSSTKVKYGQYKPIKLPTYCTNQLYMQNNQKNDKSKANVVFRNQQNIKMPTRF